MKSKPKKPEIKQGASGAHFVKIGDETLGGFHLKEHAELFLKAITEKICQAEDKE